MQRIHIAKFFSLEENEKKKIKESNIVYRENEQPLISLEININTLSWSEFYTP